MKFDRIDKKLADIGFTKIKDDIYGLRYQRLTDRFTQVVDIVKKDRVPNILQSFDPSLFDEKLIGNTCVGLTLYEMQLFCKKFKKFNRMYRKEH